MTTLITARVSGVARTLPGKRASFAETSTRGAQDEEDCEREWTRDIKREKETIKNNEEQCLRVIEWGCRSGDLEAEGKIGENSRFDDFRFTVIITTKKLFVHIGARATGTKNDDTYSSIQICFECYQIMITKFP